MAGVSADNGQRVFRNSLSGQTEAASRNLYLDELFGEGRIRRVGEAVCALLICVAFVGCLAGMPILF